MANYMKINGNFWIGDTGRRLRGDVNAQIVAMYLVTTHHAEATGVFHCPIMYIAHETGIGIESATNGITRLIEERFCVYDFDSEYVFVRRMAYHQIGGSINKNDNRAEWVKRRFNDMPRGIIRDAFLDEYGDAFSIVDRSKDHHSDPLRIPFQAPSKGLGSPLEAPSKPLQSPLEAPSKPLQSPLEAPSEAISGDKCLQLEKISKFQVVDKDIDIYKNPPLPPHGGDAPSGAVGGGDGDDDEGSHDASPTPKSKSKSPPCDHEGVIAMYHEVLPELPRVVVWGKDRARKLSARWNSDRRHQSMDFWRWFFEAVRTNPHWMGQNSTGWRPDLDWLLSPSRFARVIERGVENQRNQRAQVEAWSPSAD